jgi:hypothetical protein
MNKSLRATLVKICTSKATYFLTAVVTSSSGKCCLRSPAFIGPKRWKSESAKSGLYEGVVWQLRSGSAGPNRLAFSGQHCFQCMESNIQFHTKFPGRKPPICVDELIEALFISWADSCAGPPRKWPASQITVATVETHHPLSHCAHICCLVSVNVHQALINVSEFNDSPLLCIHFHVRCQFAILPLCCCRLATTLTNISRNVHSLLPYHQHPPLTPWARIIK